MMCLFPAGVDEVNVLEPVLPPRETVSPRVRIGCSFDEAMAGYAPNRVLDIYSSESYVLTWRGGEGRVVLKVGHQDIDKIRALWQVRIQTHGWNICVGHCLSGISALQKDTKADASLNVDGRRK